MKCAQLAWRRGCLFLGGCFCLSLALALAALAVAARPAAALVQPLSLDDLTLKSAGVVRGTVVSTHSHWLKEPGSSSWSRGTIVTDVRLRVADVLKDADIALAGLPGAQTLAALLGAGTAGGLGPDLTLQAGQVSRLTVPGGSVGDWTVIVEDAAAFAIGREYLVFLDESGGVAGWQQGNPLVVDDEVPELGLSLEDVEERISVISEQAARLQARLAGPQALLGAVQAGGLVSGVRWDGSLAALGGGLRHMLENLLSAPELVESLVASGALEPLADGGGLGGLGLGKTAGARLTFAFPAPAPQRSRAGSTATRGPAPDPYPTDVHAWMVRGPFDLSGSTRSWLTFRSWDALAAGLDRCVVALSVDGRRFTGYALGGQSDGWQLYRLALDDWPLLGDVRARAKIWVAFLFESDGLVGDEGSYVDDVALASSSGVVFRDGFERPADGLGGAWRTYGSPTWGVTHYRAATGTGSAYCVAGGPRIDGIDPSAQAAGINAQVSINGSGFGAKKRDGRVEFFYKEGEPTIPASIVSWSDERIVCRVPIGIVNRYPGSAASGPLTVVTAEGGEAVRSFSVTYGWGKAWWPSGRTVYRIKAPPKFARAVRAAAEVWNESGSPFRFVDGGVAPQDDIAVDFHNDIVWKMVEEPGVIAYARYCSFRGNVVEVDQVFNTQFEWGDGSKDTMDVQTISVHEMGHWLNLRDLYGKADGDKCMYGFGDTGQKKRTLQDGDRQGILWIYEHAPFDGAPPSTAVEPASVRSGETVTLRLRVDDPAPSCGWAMVRVRIRDADGKWVRSSSVIERRTNEWATYSFRCRLAAGSYAVHVFARDLALHEQTKVGTAALTVE